MDVWSIAIDELKRFKDPYRVYRMFSSSTEALDNALRRQSYKN